MSWLSSPTKGTQTSLFLVGSSSSSLWSKAFPGQLREVVPPACSGFLLMTGETYQEHLSREASVTDVRTTSAGFSSCGGAEALLQGSSGVTELLTQPQVRSTTLLRKLISAVSAISSFWLLPKVHDQRWGKERRWTSILKVYPLWFSSFFTITNTQIQQKQQMPH